MATVFKPIIRWAQSKERLFLTIELSDVQYPTVELTSKRLVFQGFGHGARGEQPYHVDFNFYRPVDIQASSHKVLERYVEFSIAKLAGEHQFWPRLLADEQKPAWLKINFDRWQTEDTSGSEREEQAEIEKILAASNARELELENQINKSKEEIIGFMKMFYLIVYNAMQGLSLIHI